MRLVDPSQLQHHAGPAFQKLRVLARDPRAYTATIGGSPVAIDGSILIWGCVTPEGVALTKNEVGFADILDVESMLGQLAEWRPEAWTSYLATRRRWADDLFDALALPGEGHG